VGRVPTGEARRDRPPGRHRIRGGRTDPAAAARRAAVGGLAVAAAGLAIAEAAAFLLRAAGGSPSSVVATARAGALLFEAFHHVPLVFDLTRVPAGGGPAQAGAIGFGAAPMLGTTVVVVGLWIAGRSAGRASGGLGGARALAGAAVGVPYAAACLVVAVAGRATIEVPGSASGVLLVRSFGVRPSLLASLALPLLLGAVTGASAAFVDRSADPSTPSGSGIARAALVGGWTAVALGVAFGFVGLLVLAAAEPGSTRAYLHTALAGGVARGLAVLGLTLLFVPHMAAWVVSAASGGCVAASAGRNAVCVLSYGRFPTAGTLAGLQGAHGGGLPVATTPRAYLWFVLVPAAATTAAGYVAAGRDRGGRGRGALAGASIGSVYAPLSVGVAYLARLTLSVSGPSGGTVGGPQAAWVGPSAVAAFVVALLWGGAGGAVGGALRPARRSEVRPVGGGDDDRDQQPGQPDDAQHDAGDGHPPAGLGAVGPADVLQSDEAEDHGQDRPDPPHPDDPQDQGGHGHAVRPGGGGHAGDRPGPADGAGRDG